MKLLKSFLIAAACMLCGMAAWAYEPVTLHGMVDNKYPITVDFAQPLDVVTFEQGRYCYDSVLKKKGKSACNYLYFEGQEKNNVINLVVTDCNDKEVERWRLVYKSTPNGKRSWLEGTITITSGKNKGKKHTVKIDTGAM